MAERMKAPGWKVRWVTTPSNGATILAYSRLTFRPVPAAPRPRPAPPWPRPRPPWPGRPRPRRPRARALAVWTASPAVRSAAPAARGRSAARRPACWSTAFRAASPLTRANCFSASTRVGRRADRRPTRPAAPRPRRRPARASADLDLRLGLDDLGPRLLDQRRRLLDGLRLPRHVDLGQDLALLDPRADVDRLGLQVAGDHRVEVDRLERVDRRRLLDRPLDPARPGPDHLHASASPPRVPPGSALAPISVEWAPGASARRRRRPPPGPGRRRPAAASAAASRFVRVPERQRLRPPRAEDERNRSSHQASDIQARTGARQPKFSQRFAFCPAPPLRREPSIFTQSSQRLATQTVAQPKKSFIRNDVEAVGREDEMG